MPDAPDQDDLPPDLTDDELDADDDLDELMERSALVLRPREPMISWARKMDPAATDEQLAASAVALTPRLQRGPELARWLEHFHRVLFEERLAAWTPDETTWPSDRSVEMLRAWFDIEFVALSDDFSDCYVPPEVSCEPVPLDLLVDASENLHEGGALYVDVQSGAIVALSHEDIDALDRDDPSRFGGTGEAFESLLHRLDAGILVPVLAQEAPGSIDVMQAFAMNAKIAGVRNRLLDALESKKPLRRFKEVLDAAGLRTSWREFRRGVIASMLVDLLDDYQIPYTPYTGDLPRQS